MKYRLSFALAFLTCSAVAQPIPKLDYGCSAISYDKVAGRLLVTDGAGRVFLGDLRDPLGMQIPTAGNVSQARFVADGRKILLSYRSGAAEIVDVRSPEVVSASLPAFSYFSTKVSDDGKWLVGLSTGATSIDAIDISEGTFRKFFSYEHPLGAALRLGGISKTRPIAAFIDEQERIQILDLEQRRVLPGPAGTPAKGLIDATFVDNLLWVTYDAGLMPLGRGFPLNERESQRVDGLPITKSRVIDAANSKYFVASDDLGFASVLRRTSDRERLRFETVGPARLVPRLTEAIADQSRNAIAYCGSLLEIAALDSGEILLREHARPAQSVYVENVTAGGDLALVRDMQGRSAVWDNGQDRFAATLPRLALQVFPAFGALHEGTQTYLSLGQIDVLTLARPVWPPIASADAQPRYSTEAIPLPSDGQSQGWDTGIEFGRRDANEAFVVRGKTVMQLSWTKSTGAPANPGRNFITASAADKACPAFQGLVATSPTSPHIALACDDGLGIFDLRSRRLVSFTSTPAWKLKGERFKVWVSNLSFSNDGGSIVFAVRTQRIFVDAEVDMAGSANEPSVYVFDWRRGHLIGIPTYDQVPVTAVTFSPDGKRIWIGGYWGGVSIHDRANGNLLRKGRGVNGTVFGIKFDRHGDALVWTDSGSIFRIADRSGFPLLSSVSFLSGARVRKQVKFRPSPARLPSDDLQLVEYRPAAFLANPATAKKLNVVVQASAKFRQPTQMLLYADDEVVARGTLTSSDGAGLLNIEFPIQSGLEGDISLGLYSGTGGASAPLSLGKIMDTTSAASARIVGAFVGIGKYDGLPDLPLAPGDASALAGALKGGTNVLRVFPEDQRPTRAAVLSFLKEVRDIAGPADTLVLHLSGHGMSTQYREFVFATRDTVLSPGADAKGVSSAELVDLVAGGRQATTLLILDTCDSGSFIDGVLQDPRLAEGPLSLGSSGRGLADSVSVVAATAAFRVAKEGYKGRGLLTGVLLDGLAASSDSNRDGTITQAELLQYVDRALAYASTVAFPTEKQEPVLHYATRDFDVVRGAARQGR